MKASTPLIDGLVETALDAGAAAERHPVLSLMLIRAGLGALTQSGKGI